MWVVLAVTLLALFFIWLGLSNHPATDKKESKSKVPKKVTAYVVSTTEIAQNVSVSGSLLPAEEVELRNEVSGRVVSLHLPEGRLVKKGTLLVKLFDDDLQASMHKLQVQLAVKQQIVQRQAGLLRVNGISQNDYDQTALELKTIAADIESVKASIRRTEIRAPFDGVVGLRQISEGAILAPSTTVATLRATGKIKLDFSVPEKYSALIHPGLQVSFSLGNRADKVYQAKVYATESGIESDNRNLRVRAWVNSLSEEMIAGAYANVQLKLGGDSKAILVPTDALIPDEDHHKLIVARQGKAQFVPVETGLRTASVVEITSGIQPGDTVVLNGLQFLKPGATLLYSHLKTQL